MISHQDKCLFVHIPKVAGQSIESIFVERMGLTWQQREALLLKPNPEPSRGPPRLAHLTAQEYLDYGYLTPAQFNQYFKFSFVRNPWARIVSEYNYRRQHGDSVYQSDFKTFLFKNFPTEKQDNYLLAKDYYRHVLPQVGFLYDQQGHCLVDFIGKFENIQQDFNLILSKIGLEPIELPHKNKTQASGKLAKIRARFQQLLSSGQSSRHYSEYYDLESKAFISQLYASDIAKFDYSFDVE
jgi:hypothetical protein